MHAQPVAQARKKHIAAGGAGFHALPDPGRQDADAAAHCPMRVSPDRPNHRASPPGQARRYPVMSCRSVDLPPPLCPSTPQHSPARMVQVSLSTAARPSMTTEQDSQLHHCLPEPDRRRLRSGSSRLPGRTREGRSASRPCSRYIRPRTSSGTGSRPWPLTSRRVRPVAAMRFRASSRRNCPWRSSPWVSSSTARSLGRR
jgi:hypothetical protein